MRPRFTLRKKRTVDAAIATIMLAVPASAYALTGPVSDTNANPAVTQAHTGPAQPSKSVSHTARGHSGQGGPAGRTMCSPAVRS